MNKNIKKGIAVLVLFFVGKELLSKNNTPTRTPEPPPPPPNTGGGGSGGGGVVLSYGWDNILNPQYLRNDSSGGGFYGASRGSRTHKGIDLVCSEFQSVFAPFSGRITRTFNAYRNSSTYKGVELSDENGLKIKIMYVNPNYSLVGSYVSKGQKIATCQKISNKYSPAMTDHIHVEKWVNGVNVNPTNDLL
jgi:murein DD-endopeptidase MepM/ murein hydrolase activator NlpD